MLSLKQKTVLITGASSGIGAACAESFAQQGARLILCARRVERLKQLAQSLADKYHTAVYPISLDVTQLEQVQQQLENLPESWAAIDILINNAGLAAGLDKVQDALISDWERMIDTNIKGLLYVTKTILPGMLKRDMGHIINLGSVSGHEVYAKGSVYCATKHAVKAFNKGLKLDCFGSKVRVSSIDPGIVETEFYEVRFHGDKNKANAVFEGLTPLSAHDIADAILYCATRPPHVNINQMIIMPRDQGGAGAVDKNSK